MIKPGEALGFYPPTKEVKCMTFLQWCRLKRKEKFSGLNQPAIDFINYALQRMPGKPVNQTFRFSSPGYDWRLWLREQGLLATHEFGLEEVQKEFLKDFGVNGRFRGQVPPYGEGGW